MTGNTSYRDKGRAVFFAAMMVLSVVAATASFAGAAAAADDGPDVEFDTSDLDEDVFIGQEVKVTNGASGFDGAVRVKQGFDSDEDADTIETVRLDSDDNVTIDITEDEYTAGEPYFLEDTSTGETFGTMWVNEHDVTFEFDDATVGEEQAANLTFDDEDVGQAEMDNREDITLEVTAEYDGNALGESTLSEIFANYDGDADVTVVENDDGDDYVEITNANVGDYWNDLTFEDQELGTYNFTIDVADTTASDTAEVTVDEDSETEVTFDTNNFEGVVGDNVEITVDVSNAMGSDAYIDVTHEDIDGTLGQIQIDNIDEDEDEVTVVLNTYNVSKTDAHEDSEAEVTTSGFDNYLQGDDGEYEPLPALDYELEALNTANGDETDAAFMTLDERSTDSISTWVVPQDVDAQEDELDEILNESTQRDYIAQNDTLVTQVEASGVYGYLLDNGDWNEESGLELTYEEVDDSAFSEPDTFNITELEDSNHDVRIETDDEEDTFYVIFSTKDLENVGADDAAMQAGQTWNAEFRVTSENAFIDDDASEDDEESVDTEFDVEDREIDFVGEFDDDDRLQVENSPEAEITAETNAAPGTEVDFRVRTDTDVQYGDALVAEDGMVSTTFDLSNHEAGDDIRNLRVSEVDAETSTEGVFVQADEQPAEPAPEFTVDTEAPSEVTVNESAELGVTLANDGDANGTTNLTVTVNGETVDDTTKELAAGEDASFSYDIPTSEAGDVSWEVTVDDDSASGTVTVAEEGDGEDGTDGEDGEDGTDGEDGEDGTDGEDGEDGTDSEDGGDGSDGDSEGQPGFGVAVALVAMLAAAMLALRRQN